MNLMNFLINPLKLLILNNSFLFSIYSYPPMKENEIDNFMTKLHSRSETDQGFIKNELNRFLTDEYKDIVSYMNDAFFIRD
jgi:hypothetical protein